MPSLDLPTTLVRMLPFALAGAFLPTWTRDVILLLGTGRPPHNAVAYILGNAVFRLALGAGVLFGLDASAIADRMGGLSEPSAGLLGAAAAGCLGLAAWLFARRRALGEEPPGWLTALERVRPSIAFALGAGFVALPGAQYLYFLSALGVLASARLPVPATLGVLVALVVFLQLMLAMPVGVFLAMPGRSRRALDVTKAWLARRGETTGAVVLVLAAAYLAVAAARAAVGG